MTLRTDSRGDPIKRAIIGDKGQYNQYIEDHKQDKDQSKRTRQRSQPISNFEKSKESDHYSKQEEVIN